MRHTEFTCSHRPTLHCNSNSDRINDRKFVAQDCQTTHTCHGMACQIVKINKRRDNQHKCSMFLPQFRCRKTHRCPRPKADKLVMVSTFAHEKTPFLKIKTDTINTTKIVFSQKTLNRKSCRKHPQCLATILRG